MEGIHLNNPFMYNVGSRLCAHLQAPGLVRKPVTPAADEMVQCRVSVSVSDHLLQETDCSFKNKDVFSFLSSVYFIHNIQTHCFF